MDDISSMDKALMALQMVRDNTVGESWCAGVAMSALASIEEEECQVKLGDCFWCPGVPFDLGIQLCDDDGIVRKGRFHSGTDYPCTGGAHFADKHIRCTSPSHEQVT